MVAVRHRSDRPSAHPRSPFADSATMLAMHTEMPSLSPPLRGLELPQGPLPLAFDALGQRLNLSGRCVFCDRKFDVESEDGRRQPTEDAEPTQPSANQVEDLGVHTIEGSSSSRRRVMTHDGRAPLDNRMAPDRQFGSTVVRATMASVAHCRDCAWPLRQPCWTTIRPVPTVGKHLQLEVCHVLRRCSGGTYGQTAAFVIDPKRQQLLAIWCELP
jgi:hypothetical protein